MDHVLSLIGIILTFTGDGLIFLGLLYGVFKVGQFIIRLGKELSSNRREESYNYDSFKKWKNSIEKNE
jgi:hypothetical protein